MDDALQQVIDFLKTASPVIWQTLIRQVYSEAISYLVWAFVLGGISFALAKLFIYGTKQLDEDTYSVWNLWRWVCVVVSGFAGLTSFGILVSAIQWFANPEFYAIRFLLDRLTGN